MKYQLSSKKAIQFLNHNGIILASIFIIVFATIKYDNFFSFLNIGNVIRQSSINGFVAIGMMFVIVAGGIDLSVGSVVALCGVLAAKLSGTSFALSIILPLMVGLLIGFINGLLVTKIKMEPFVATLSTMMGIRGIAYIITGEVSIGIDKASEAFVFLGRGEFFNVIPVPSLLFFVCICIAAYIFKYTSFGRNIYAVGGNHEAAKMMGVKVDVITIRTHIICSFLAAIAGVILAARLGAGQPVAGDGYELKAIASVVLGGTFLTGGVGKISGTIFGVMVMGLITNIFNMQGNISTYWQNVITGLMLLIIVLIQSININRK